MSLEKELLNRSGSTCELCKSADCLQELEVSKAPTTNVDAYILACDTCRDQISGEETLDTKHWRCLNDSMWSEVPAVQVMAYRMLNKLNAESWAQDLLDMIYLEEDTLAWAKAGIVDSSASVVHKDSNGNVLQSGDTVVITQTLKVKGSSVTAKRGTAVRNISLVYDNAEQIEGRVEGQQVVILTKFVKKSK